MTSVTVSSSGRSRRTWRAHRPTASVEFAATRPSALAVAAGGGVRAVLEAAGVKNVLTKSMGSNNHNAVVNATLDGLRKLRLAEDIKALRS